MTPDDSCSAVADRQLDALEVSDDVDLYKGVLESCELVFRRPAWAQAKSSAIMTVDDRVILRLPVAGYPPFKRPRLT